MKVTGGWLQQAMRLSGLAGAALPFLFTSVSGESVSLPEPHCPTVKQYAQRVDLHDLSQLAPKDVRNIKAASKAITELAQLDTIYIDKDYNDLYGMKEDISPRTVIFPHASCPSGCTGYIVSATEYGFSSVPFYYRYNVKLEPRGIDRNGLNKNSYGGLILLDIDQRNIIVLQRRNRTLQDAPTLIIAPASQAGTYYNQMRDNLICLAGEPLGVSDDDK